MKQTLLWIKEALQYDPCVVLRFWWNGKDFLKEREKWVQENTQQEEDFQRIYKIL